MRTFLETNVYSFRGVVLICGTCLPEVYPESFASLSGEADQVFSLCLERDHLNLAVAKLTAILGTGQVTRILFATVDRSPHCVQMHYMTHEIERILPAHIPMQSYVVTEQGVTPVSPQSIDLSKSLARLERLGQA